MSDWGARVQTATSPPDPCCLWRGRWRVTLVEVPEAPPPRPLTLRRLRAPGLGHSPRNILLPLLAPRLSRDGTREKADSVSAQARLGRCGPPPRLPPQNQVPAEGLVQIRCHSATPRACTCLFWLHLEVGADTAADGWPCRKRDVPRGVACVVGTGLAQPGWGGHSARLQCQRTCVLRCPLGI